ncbi:hypothetical protein [Thauera sp.]|uniref:hypothetical protein n=1 Tax=Thauera sp. TaxID=1905334 RepID=UPI002B85A64A|nr:hypothetical protein [Thauera sp.]HRP26053.1 hypothetical protein [Thauera sp.]
MRAARILINGGERYVRRDVLERLGITGRRIDDPALLRRAVLEDIEADRADLRRDDERGRG